MKNLMISISLACIMAFSMNNVMANGPVDGNKLKTTIKCGSEKKARIHSIKSSTKKTPLGKASSKKDFTKKRYHIKKAR